MPVVERAVTSSFIRVVTGIPEDVKKWLAPNVREIDRGTLPHGRTWVLLRLDATSDRDVKRLAFFQAQRLTANWHRAVIHDTEAEAREQLPAVYVWDAGYYHPTCLVETLINRKDLPSGSRFMAVEDVLRQVDWDDEPGSFAPEITTDRGQCSRCGRAA